MWDPTQYLAFADHRSRPFFELVTRIGAENPRRVVDLGCGPGNLTETLRARWPRSTVEAMDSAPEMVAAARGRGIAAEAGDVRDWQPSAETDVVVCNAVLHWVAGHDELLVRWAKRLTPGAWLAFQVPGNFGAPSHVRVRELVAEPRWRERLEAVRPGAEDTVRTPEGYAALLSDAGCVVDAWETTYVQRLTGPDPVLEWITGTTLRPIRAALADLDWQEFRDQLAPRLRADYPERADGTTWYPFRRVFAVARVSS